MFWAGVSVPLQLGLPDTVPPQYGALREVSIHTARARLRLLYHFSDLMYSSWRLLNLSPNNQVTRWLGSGARAVLTRSLGLFFSLKILPPWLMLLALRRSRKGNSSVLILLLD